MKIAERLLEGLSALAAEHRVARVQIGLVYTAAQLQSSAVGVSYTFSGGGSCRGAASRGRTAPLAGREAAELLKGLGGADLLGSSVAAAVANALLAASPLPEGARAGDVLEALTLRPGDNLCMVGCFLPVLAALEEKAVNVTTVDEVPKPGSLPAGEVEKLLPRSDVAVITATSIVNGSIDRLLGLAENCREVLILGPSTPMLPEAFAGTPVSCLSGVRVREPEAVMRSIGEGGGFCEFKRYVQKYNLRIRDARS